MTVQLLFDDTRAKVNHTESWEAIVFPLDGMIDPQDVFAVDHDDRDFEAAAPAGVHTSRPGWVECRRRRASIASLA